MVSILHQAPGIAGPTPPKVWEVKGSWTVISLNFAYANAGGIGPLQAPEEGGALWMVAVCSETGYLLGLPLKSKEPRRP